MHSPRATINAIQRLESLIVCGAELQSFPGAQNDVRQIRSECEFLLDQFEDLCLIACPEEIRMIEQMEKWLLSLDAVFRPDE